MSNALHDRLQVGGVLDVAPPQGDFQLREAGGAPVVLLSGGVGLTPMVSMLNHLVRADDGRQIRFVHGCRNRDAHAMRDHVNTIAAGRGNVRKAVFYEEVGGGDEPGRDYDYAGRVDLRAIRDAAILPGADYYLCGRGLHARPARGAAGAGRGRRPHSRRSLRQRRRAGLNAVYPGGPACAEPPSFSFQPPCN